MDNILKLLLGVLGVAGLIAMVASNFSFEPPQSAVALPPPAVAPSSPLGNEGEEALPEEAADAESPEEDGEDILAIGEPLIDGNPYGSNNQQQPNNGQMPYDPSQAGNFNYGNAAQQGYSYPQNYAPQQAYVPQQSYSPPPQYAPQNGNDFPVDGAQ